MPNTTISAMLPRNACAMVAGSTGVAKYVLKHGKDNLIPSSSRVKNNIINSKLVKCKRDRCITCKHIDESSTFASCSHGTNYVRDTNIEYCCADKNVVYLLSCKQCGFHYVGETTQQLKKRFLQHKGDVRNNKKATYLVKHFSQNGHTVEDMRINVLEHAKESKKEAIKAELRQLERNWILALNTAFPFGMNNNIKELGNISQIVENSKLLTSKLPYFRITTIKNRKRSKTKKRRNKAINKEFFNTLDAYVTTNKHRQIYSFLRSVNKNTLKYAIKLMETCKLKPETHLTVIGYYLGFHSTTASKVTNDKDQPKIIINYPSSIIASIGLERKIYNYAKNMLGSCPISNNIGKPTIVYKYGKKAGQELFTYNSYLKKNTMQELENTIETGCKCSLYHTEYMDQVSNHVITTNMSILANNNHTEIMNYGTNYRFDQQCMQSNQLDASMKNVGAFAKRYIKLQKEVTNDKKIESFIAATKKLITSKIRITESHLNKNIQQIKKNEHYQNFICTPVDKASNNYAFICKKWYIQCLFKEIGIGDGATSNQTYILTNVNAESLKQQHMQLYKKFSIETHEDYHEIPVLYGIPKLHKNPIKFRFISGAAKATTKPLAKLLLKILTHMKKHFANYCKTAETRSNTKNYFSINNSMDVINKFSNKNAKIKSMAAYDFSTLYTKMTHNSILNTMFELIDMLFQNAGTDKIITSKSLDFGSTYYTKNAISNNSNIVMHKNEIKDLLQTVLYESYIRIADQIYRQIAGVPMGGNSSGALADLTLSYMEFKYTKANKPWNNEAMIFRYIDDILTININLDEHYKGIYPVELELNKESAKNNELNYLDITFNQSTNHTQIYNKTDVFNFHVNRAYHSSTCVHPNMIQGIIIGQILRFCRISSDLGNFKDSLLKYAKQLKEKEHKDNSFLLGLIKFCTRYEHMLWKYNLLDRKDIVKKIIAPIENSMHQQTFPN